MHPSFKWEVMKGTQLLIMIICSVRKIKTKWLQNTVQSLAVTNKVASGNNAFAKNAFLRHLNRYIFFNIDIKIKYALKQHSQIPVFSIVCVCTV